MPRPFRLLPVVLALATLSLASGAPSVGADDVITFEPSHPTWHDALTIRVDTFDRGCGGARLSEPEIRNEQVNGEFVRVIEIVVEDSCGVLPSPTAVTLTTTIDPIWPGPGQYLVRVSHQQSNRITEAELEVFEPADEKLVLEGPFRNDEPFVVSAKVFGSCVGIDVEPFPEQGIVLAHYSDVCHILPPGPAVQTVSRATGPLAPGVWEVVLLDSAESQAAWKRVVVYDAEGCVPSDTRLCLHDGRFAVEATWKDFEGGTGVAHALPLEDLSDSGLMWFFRDTNVELTVKVLRGCQLTGSWWVSLSSTSDVEFEVVVTDTSTEETRTYRNELGDRFVPLQDMFAFPCP